MIPIVPPIPKKVLAPIAPITIHANNIRVTTRTAT